MTFLCKKTENAIIDVLAKSMESLHRATDATDWLLKLVKHKDDEIARLQSELGGLQAVRDHPSLSKYVN